MFLLKLHFGFVVFFPVWGWFTFIATLFLIVRLQSFYLNMFFESLRSALGGFDG